MFEEKYCYLNGKIIDERNASISIKDRGFRFGDGVFETIKIHNLEVKDQHLHMERLKKSLLRSYINYDIRALPGIIKTLILKNKQVNGFLRISISRGVGSRGYKPQPGIEPTVLIEVQNAYDNSVNEMSLYISTYQKISPKALPVESKISQGMNSILSYLEADMHGCDDALLLNHKQKICETSSANFFGIKKGKLYTPSLKSGILNGIIRTKIIENFEVREREIRLREIKKFDFIFITNVAMGTCKIHEIKYKQSIIWLNKENKKSLSVFLKINNFLSE
jgi:branched-subunit amino acid aminotransferase/4-amino-4-deoxychorismate lyase